MSANTRTVIVCELYIESFQLHTTLVIVYTRVGFNLENK